MAANLVIKTSYYLSHKDDVFSIISFCIVIFKEHCFKNIALFKECLSHSKKLLTLYMKLY